MIMRLKHIIRFLPSIPGALFKLVVLKRPPSTSHQIFLSTSPGFSSRANVCSQTADMDNQGQPLRGQFETLLPVIVGKVPRALSLRGLHGRLRGLCAHSMVQVGN